MPDRAEQTRVEQSLGRQPCSRAVAAERLGNRSDDADLTRPVDVAIAARDLTAIVRIDGLDAERRVEHGDDLRSRYDVVEPPAVRRSDVHELDESHDVTRAAKMSREVDD